MWLHQSLVVLGTILTLAITPHALNASDQNDRNPDVRMNQIVVPDNFTTLSEALAHSSGTATIRIKPGTYRFGKTLVLDRNITLVGEGNNAKSVILCRTGLGPALKLTAEKATIKNLSIETQDGAGICITAGKPQLHRCRVTAKKIRKNKNKNKSQNRVSKFYFEGVGLILENSNTAPVVTECELYECSYTGIIADKKSQGTIKKCKLHDNNMAGILVINEANPIITDCQICDGIMLSDKGRGTFKKCKVHGSEGGFLVTNESNPTVTDCEIYNHKVSGIQVGAKGLGTFKKCKLHGNNVGITVSEESNPTISNCKISDSEMFGIMVVKKGRGTFKRCEVQGTASRPKIGGWGIGIGESGNPTVIDCEIHNNEANGILVSDKGQGTFRNCKLYENLTGIVVSEQGNPTVENCSIYNNKGHGIAIVLGGKGRFINNRLSENKGQDWKIMENAEHVFRSGNSPNE